MSKLRMRSVHGGLVLLILALALPAPAKAGESPEGLKLSQEVSGYQIDLVFPFDKVKPGETSFFIRVKDGQGVPVEGLEVTLALESPVKPDSHGAPAGDDHSQKPADAHASAPAAEETLPGEEHGHEPDDDHAEVEPTPSGDDPGHAPEDSHDDEPGTTHLETGAIRLIGGHSKGEYEGKLNFTQAGRWTIHLTLAGDHDRTEAEFVVDVDGGSTKAIVLGSFLAFNLFVLLAAVVMKQKAAVSR